MATCGCPWLIPDDLLPCLILDLDERESGTVLATYDPVSELAQPDLAQLHGLAAEIRAASLPHVSAFLDILETVMPPAFAAETEGAHYREKVQPGYSVLDPFLFPYSISSQVWVWLLFIPLSEFDEFIQLGKALSAHLGFGDNASALVTHCLEVVHATLD